MAGGRAIKRFEHYHITSLTQSPGATGMSTGPLGNKISHGGHIDDFDGHGEGGGGGVVLRNRSMVVVVRCIVGIMVNDYIQFYLLSSLRREMKQVLNAK
jgi:hypothetical protein